MSKREEIETKTEELLLPILSEKGLKLWDVEYVNEASEWYLRAFIDKEGGVGFGALSDRLDEKDFIDDAYTLEVSSPGLGRTLKRDRDFANSIGRDVDLKLYKAIDGVKEFGGTLKAYDKESITVSIEEEEKRFSRKELASVKLSFEP